MGELEVSEAQVRVWVSELLAIRGFVILSTDPKRRRCPGCGRTSQGGSGVSKGTPDLMVRHPNWALGIWLGVELKGPRTSWSSPQQKEFFEAGGTLLVRASKRVHGRVDVLWGSGAVPWVCEPARAVIAALEPITAKGDNKECT